MRKTGHKLLKEKSYIHRDISWLSFNYRVLQEAKDPNVPLLERIKFLAIYSSNLDEFFRVRIANHKTIMRAGKKAREDIEFKPKEILNTCLEIVNDQQEEFSEIQERIFKELKKEGVNILKRKDLDPIQIEFVEEYFKDALIPYVQPVLLLQGKVKPFLHNGSIYLLANMTDLEDGSTQYGLVTIPSNETPRFVDLPPNTIETRDIILLDDIVRHTIRYIFPGYKIKNTYSVKLTRDAELYIDDEYSGNLLNKIKKSIKKRNVGPASRLIYDRRAPDEIIDYLKNSFDLSDYDLLPEGRYHNNSNFFSFSSEGLENHMDTELEPVNYPPFENRKSIFDVIENKDHLLYFPYHSYEPVIQFFEDAAVDKTVTHIKVIQYRVASQSRIMEALKMAVSNGKRVTVFIEIKARFDEEANLKWGEVLEKAGVKVVYSLPGIKVHSKLAIVRRVVKGAPKIYCYLSTGNFNENTAGIYTDFGFFTFNKDITAECLNLIKFLESKKLEPFEFEHLGVGTYNLKPLLKSLVKTETKNAEKGRIAKIFLKMNSLQDPEMINLLYKASNAGVEIRLIIRGICSLVPGIKNQSENIEVTSIVDRFLEHARVFIFHNGGKEKVFLSSADWMTRNLHRRIETMFPIYDKKLHRIIKVIMKFQIDDNVKARCIGGDYENTYKKTDSELAIRSQLETYAFIKREMERMK